MSRPKVRCPFGGEAAEREVIINQTDDEREMRVYVSSPVWYRYFVRQGYEPFGGDKYGVNFKVPTVNVPKAGRKKRAMTGEQRAKAAERLAQARKVERRVTEAILKAVEEPRDRYGKPEKGGKGR